MIVKLYDVKYEIGTKVFVNILNTKIEAKIDEIRIVESSKGIKIHYLVIIPEHSIGEGIYKNFEWIDENDIL